MIFCMHTQIYNCKINSSTHHLWLSSNSIRSILLKTCWKPGLQQVVSSFWFLAIYQLGRYDVGNPPSGGLNANVAILHVSKAISWKRCKIGSKLVLITNRKSYMIFWLVPKLVTWNDLERRNGPYFALFHRIFVHDVAKQLLGLRRFQNLLLIVYDHIKTICTIIQRLFGQNKLITRFDGRRRSRPRS